MAQRDWLWMAQFTVRHGISANAGLRLAQQEGLGVRRSIWLQAVSQIRTNAALRAAAAETILVALPQPTNIEQLPTRTATGYVQYVSLAVRDKATGLLNWRDQALHTDSLLSREAAIDTLIERYRLAVDRSKTSPATWGTNPDEVVEGGIYVATMQFTPDSL